MKRRFSGRAKGVLLWAGSVSAGVSMAAGTGGARQEAWWAARVDSSTQVMASISLVLGWGQGGKGVSGISMLEGSVGGGVCGMESECVCVLL